MDDLEENPTNRKHPYIGCKIGTHTVTQLEVYGEIVIKLHSYRGTRIIPVTNS